MVIKQLVVQMIIDCGVSTTACILRNRHQPGENFSADSKRSVCWDGRAGNDPVDSTTARPSTWGSACSQFKTKLDYRAGHSCTTFQLKSFQCLHVSCQGTQQHECRPISMDDLQVFGVKSDHNNNASLPQASSRRRVKSTSCQSGLSWTENIGE